MSSQTAKQLLEPPATDASHVIESLGYIDAYDAVLDDDYAFVAFRQIERSSGEWCVRIASRGTAGATFDPAAMRQKARGTGAQGLPYFSWGNTMEPSAGDPRHIEFRVHVVNSQPTEIEICLQMRKFDHSADEPKSIRFAWPIPY